MELTNSEHLPPAYRPQPISEKERFELAQNHTLVMDADEKEIREALRYCMVKIGLRAANFPQGVEKMLLIQHVKDTYPTLTIEEIRMAFDWAINGRTHVEVNCYENFSCRYFSQIVNAYLDLKRTIPPPRAESNLIEYKREEMTPEEWATFLNSPFAKRLRNAGVNIPE